MDLYLNQLLQLLLIIVAWWLFTHEYRQYRIDLLRQRLFVIRDDLFREAASGNFAFDSEAYTLTRTTLNGMIRFAHDISFTRLIIMSLTQRVALKDNDLINYRQTLKNSLDGLSHESKKSILEAHGCMHIAVALHIVHTSLFLAPFIIPLLWLLRTLKRTQEIKQKLRKTKLYRHYLAPKLDAEANGIGNEQHFA